MSYYAEICFKKMNPEDILPFFREFKKEVSGHLEEIAEDNYHYNPVLRRLSWGSKMPEYMECRKEIGDWARTSVFQFRYTYDYELGLLAMFNVHPVMNYMFDNRCEFQNSCDQDYSFDHWEGIQAFEDIYSRWQSASVEDIIYSDYSYADMESYEEADDKDEWLNYWRRSSAYDEIWSHWENVMMNDEEAVYLSLYGYYDLQTVGAFSRLVYDLSNKYFDE